MAGSYILPQVRVFQEFAETPNDVTQNLNPFIIGMNYKLIRYSDKNERIDCTRGTFTGISLDLPWNTSFTGTSVDATWYSVTLADAYVGLGDALQGTCLDPTEEGLGTKFEFTLAPGKSLTGDNKNELQFGTPVRVGDYLGYHEGNSAEWKFTKIRSISIGTPEPGEVLTDLRKAKTGKIYDGMVANAAGYTGEKPVTVRIDVASGNKITWHSDVAGMSSDIPTVLTPGGVDLGKGLKLSYAVKVSITDKDSNPYSGMEVDASRYTGSTVNIGICPATAAGGKTQFKLKVGDTFSDLYDYTVGTPVDVTVADGTGVLTFTFTQNLPTPTETNIPLVFVGLSQTDVEVGKYILSVTMTEASVKDTVTVSAMVSANTDSFTFTRRLDEVELSNDYVSVGDTGVTVDADASVVIGGEDRTVLSATAYLNQRNAVRAHTDGIYTVRTEADIIRELGAISVDNPLAYGANVMRLNCANVAIRYIALESDDSTGWAKALDRASVSTDVYAFCPLSEDATVIESVVAHCNTMSAPEEKSWRIAFFSLPTVSETDVTPRLDGVAEKCTVDSRRVLTCRPADGSITERSAISKFTENVRESDEVSVISATGVSYTAKVTKVISDSTLELDTVIPSADTELCTFRVVHHLGDAEYVSAIAATSSRFRDKRAYNVFPNRLRDTDGNFVSGMYGAAAVCALACSVQPQQPITNVEIKGFTDLPDVYSKYSREQLNEIASGGTLIIMQDRIGGTVYVRHQISTAYPDHNLNTTELSLVKNLDSISYYFANRFAPYIGRYNVTEELLAEIRAVLSDGIAYISASTESNRLVGPQIISEGTEIRSIFTSSEEKDKVYANVALNLPAPFNNFDLHLQVI